MRVDFPIAKQSSSPVFSASKNPGDNKPNRPKPLIVRLGKLADSNMTQYQFVGFKKALQGASGLVRELQYLGREGGRRFHVRLFRKLKGDPQQATRPIDLLCYVHQGHIDANRNNPKAGILIDPAQENGPRPTKREQMIARRLFWAAIHEPPES